MRSRRNFLVSAQTKIRIVLTLALLLASSRVSAKPIGKLCTLHDIPLYGKVKVVNAFANFKVQVVHAFPDLKVERVGAFADTCGKWQFVDAFPDFTIQYVDAFADFKVQWVDVFSAMTR